MDVRTQSLQNALDTATDVNNDGYIIVGVVARDGKVPGGQGHQQVDVTRAYPSPFALIGCGVTLMDPAFCDGHAVVDIRASATSPEFPAGSGVTLYFQEITATGSVSAPGWLVRGDGRFFEGIGSKRQHARNEYRGQQKYHPQQLCERQRGWRDHHDRRWQHRRRGPGLEE